MRTTTLFDFLTALHTRAVLCSLARCHRAMAHRLLGALSVGQTPVGVWGGWEALRDGLAVRAARCGSSGAQERHTGC
jgi:hypothetical protein